jgi:homoserine O-succinyltransferase
MPIIVPDGLPAADVLSNEDHIDVMQLANANRQDIREQHFAILNIMPTSVKKRTERQLARLLGHTSLHVKMDLLIPESTPESEQDPHLSTFYKPWESVQDQQYDGLIVTGAPVEHLDWNEVRYWDELRKIIDWSRTNVTTRVFICWGAQAALKHNYGLDKVELPQKAFGVFSHTVNDPSHPLMSGFDDEFFVPVSRHTEIPLDALKAQKELSILSESRDTGAYIIADKNNRDIFVTNHPEYGKGSLDSEYQRDKQAGKEIDIPPNYYPDNDSSRIPTNRWRAHARLLYATIINQTYQRTPLDRRDIVSLPENLPYHR